MARYQPARSAVGESVAEFMERRRREVVQLGHEAEAAGREAWAAATRAGGNLLATTPSDVRALGARVLAGRAPAVAVGPRTVSAAGAALTPGLRQVTNTSSHSAAQHGGGTVQYGALLADLPSNRELAELRRQQAAFGETSRQIDIGNSWFAAPVLAAPLAVMGLEAAGALAGRALVRPAEEAALDFLEREPHLRVGDNWATRAGRRAHAALKERLAQKPGWDYEPSPPTTSGRVLKPDVGAPVRNPAKPTARYQMELKPNTPTGRRAAERAARHYEGETRNKTRGIFYDPKDYI